MKVLKQKASLSIIAWLKENLATQVWQKIVSRVVDRTERLYSNWLKGVVRVQFSIFGGLPRSCHAALLLSVLLGLLRQRTNRPTGTQWWRPTPRWWGRESPSGRFSSERLRPSGSFETEMPAASAGAMALATRSFKAWWLADLPGPSDRRGHEGRMHRPKPYSGTDVGNKGINQVADGRHHHYHHYNHHKMLYFLKNWKH